MRFLRLLAAVAAEVKASAMRFALQLRLTVRSTAVWADWAVRPTKGF